MSALHQPGHCIQKRYEIVHTIGQGGGGTTYEAKDLHRDRSVAIKSLSLKQIQDWKTLELLEREANVLAELDHPSIPQYLDHFTIDTAEDYSFYLVQELAPGKSIATLVENGWQPTEKIAKNIAHQVLQVLDYLHSQVPPILHRDIKPENLIYTKTGKIYLVDFGAVQAVYHQTIAANSTLVGTFGYMPLEQINGKAQPASDLYALGASLVYLLTHCSPSELPQKHLKIDFRQSTVTSVSKLFANWLEKMLEPDVDNRFQSAKEALQNLSKPANKSSKTYQRQTSNFSRVFMFLLLVASISIVGTSTAENWSTWLNFNNSERKDSQPSTSYADKSDQNAKTSNVENEAPSISLLYAAKSGNIKMVERSLSNGANLNQTDESGRTPLYLAARYGHPDVVSRLLAAGAQVETKTYENGRTPLYIASGFGNFGAVKQLLEAGARVNAKTYNGWRPIHNASKHGHFNIVKQLLAADARVNVKTNEGFTPLVLANDGGIRKLLLRNGAEPSR
jgi:serine/threonine protein kinase